MTIAMIAKVAAGNALRVFLQPPADAARWRLLRKVSDDFAGHDDPDAALVHDGGDRTVTDDEGLVNGVTYFYRPYYLSGSIWTPGATASAAPAVGYHDLTDDVQAFVRDRMALGLRAEVERGELHHDDGAVPVFTAPPVYDNARWPVVTVLLVSEDPAERFVGEQLGGDEFDGEEWEQSEGWLARVRLDIVAWSLNSDERLALRRAMRRIVIANLPVFDARGFTNVEFGQQHMEDFESYNAPVYQAVCSFTCLAPVAVSSKASAIEDSVQQITV